MAVSLLRHKNISKFVAQMTSRKITTFTPTCKDIDVQHDVIQNSFQKAVQHYYNTECYDVNWKLGDVDGLCHHHYGVGDYDRSIRSIVDPETRFQHTVKELHRMETAQASYVLDQFGDIKPTDALLDAGCGRGGTSIMANLRLGCKVDGVTISERQAELANGQAKRFGVDNRVKFHFRNMLANGLPSESIRLVWNNESSMYVDLFDLFKEHNRVLRIGGRFVCVTGTYGTKEKSQSVKAIDKFYGAPFENIFRSTFGEWSGPVNTSSEWGGGIFPECLAYRTGDFYYMLIVADKAAV